MRRKVMFGIAIVVLLACGFVEARRRADTSSINPVGRPEAKGKGLHCAVFFEAGTWKIRAGNGNGRHTFKGVVNVEGGTIVQGGPIGEEDAAHPQRGKTKREIRNENKKENNDDDVAVHKDKAGFDFQFVTHGAEDGIDFVLSKDAKTVSFHIVIDGDDDPKKIVIGREAAHPESGSFELPAKPN